MFEPRISIVIPLYNEEDSLPELIERLTLFINKESLSFEVVLVDDGSKDRTTEMIKNYALEDPRFTAVFLSRNYGHQTALTAGLKESSGTEGVMMMDGDLQDPPEMFSIFYKHLLDGYDVIYAVREKRKGNILKKIAYFFFYRFLNFISYIPIPLDSGDFSLVSRRVVNIMNNMHEQSRYLRGMRTWVGFRQIGIPYKRDERKNGITKYTLKKLIGIALTGIFNFSELPVKLIINLGLLSIFSSFIYLVYTLIRRFYFHSIEPGFTALLFVIILFSGVQLISIGILGEYIVRIFFQVKNRPLFIIKNKIIKQKNLNE